jgi:hypothetical protein
MSEQAMSILMGVSSMSGADQKVVEVHVSGIQLPYTKQWMYRVSVDGSVKDEINSTRKWTPQEMFDVQGYYTESLTGYIFSGEHIEGWTPPTNPTIRQPVFRNRRRTIKAVDE